MVAKISTASIHVGKSDQGDLVVGGLKRSKDRARALICLRSAILGSDHASLPAPHGIRNSFVLEMIFLLQNSLWPIAMAIKKLTRENHEKYSGRYEVVGGLRNGSPVDGAHGLEQH